MRARFVWLAAALTAVALAIIPTLAAGQSSSASFTATDSSGAYGASHSWQSNQGGSQVTIAQGGTVNFSYTSANASTPPTQHNVDFSSGPTTPSCTQTQGANNTPPEPPMPHSPTMPDWAGHCTFSAPGTYMFHCDLHTNMTGTVVVK